MDNETGCNQEQCCHLQVDVVRLFNQKMAISWTTVAQTCLALHCPIKTHLRHILAIHHLQHLFQSQDLIVSTLLIMNFLSRTRCWAWQPLTTWSQHLQPKKWPRLRSWSPWSGGKRRPSSRGGPSTRRSVTSSTWVFVAEASLKTFLWRLFSESQFGWKVFLRKL